MTTPPGARDDLEQALAAALSRHLAAADSRCPPNLAEAIRYSLLAPGKRIRPRLSLACARMIGLDGRAAWPAALALEMIHCFTLIHDDLPCMDDDDFRRGRPSSHKVHGEALALLAGDALIPLAIDCFSEAAPHVAPAAFAAALRRLSWASGPRGVIGGQAAEALLGPGSRLEDLAAMHAMKTGALFAAALLVPKDLAGIPDESAGGRAIDLFSRELGLAFQVADDLEDATESREPTSVLHYLSAADAARWAAERLAQACRALGEAWGSPAAELVEIAAEVSRKLGGGSAGGVKP